MSSGTALTSLSAQTIDPPTNVVQKSMRAHWQGFTLVPVVQALRLAVGELL
ncbi:MAG TPA: hypothetical protein VL371_11460 [Gemmataceae bacterium]|jgi:hypothetical protein|nr:hypothetical protein [Gemmataceae bacterium]